MSTKDGNKEWLVVKTRHNAERKVVSSLSAVNIESFLPEYTTQHKWSDRIKKIKRPLIPSTVFVKTELSKHYDIYSIPLVTGILKEFGKPAIVKDFEINNLQIIAREFSGENIEQCTTSHFDTGDYVKVKRGPFKGLEGNLVEIQGKSRIVVQISSVNTSFLINISASQIEKKATKTCVL